MSYINVDLYSYSGLKYTFQANRDWYLPELATAIYQQTGILPSQQKIYTTESTSPVVLYGIKLEDSLPLSYYVDNFGVDNTISLRLNIIAYYTFFSNNILLPGKEIKLNHTGPVTLNDSTRVSTHVNNIVGFPYSPQFLRSVYKSTPVSSIPNKKQVVITIVIGAPISQLYLQSCLDLFCDEYHLPRTELEVITLGPDPPAEIANINNLLINNVIAYVNSLSGFSQFNMNDFINIYYPIDNSTPKKKQDSELFQVIVGMFIGGLFETLLDSQWSYSMNTNAHIRIVQAPTMFPDSLYNAVSYASNPTNFIGNKWGPTDIISMSWGSNDINLTLSDFNILDLSFNNNKICYLASSMDHYIVGYPSTSANVLGVGGTSLYTNTLNQSTQTFWNNNNGNGGGCGPSIITPKPSYQSNVNELNSFTTKCSPDISSISDPNTGVLIFIAGSGSAKSYVLIGGTSLACPLNAGMLSNLIQTSINNNGPSFTTVVNNGDSILLQDVLYTIYNNPKLYSECFYDVVLGGVNQYQAKIGFDIPTGLGTPLWDNITELLLPTLSSDICFPNNTPILTDQGIINIEDIDIHKHTINNNKIVAITQSIHNDNYLVNFFKDSLGKNIPSQDTITSSRHKVYYKNKMIEAREIANINKNVTKIKYNKSILYNILLDKHYVIYVNNMICETLHPDNIIAKLYTRFTYKQARDEIIYKLNKYIKNKDYVSYKSIINRIENTHTHNA